MNQVHIVEGHVAYEGSRIIKVFSDKEKADAFAKAGNDHNGTYPELPPEATLRDRVEYISATKNWFVNHPVKGGYQHEDYSVTSHEVEP